MYEKITNIHANLLDDVIYSRRTIREFDSMIPDQKSIMAVVEAGLAAPFLSVDGKVAQDFKKVFVLRNTSPLISKVSAAMKLGIAEHIKHLEEYDPSSSWLPHLRKCVRTGSPDLINVPYTVIIMEKSGLAPFTSKSLSHCLQNMWLKATSLKIGCQLISEIYVLTNALEFCKVLGVTPGAYEFDGCVLGYPAHNYVLPRVNYPITDLVVSWL